MNESIRKELKQALHSTYQVIGHDLQEARATCGESGPIPRDELIEVVLDQTYGSFAHVRVSKEAAAEWKSLCTPARDAELQALAEETFTFEVYE